MTILSQKNIPLFVQPKAEIDLTNPEIANNPFVIQKHQHLKLKKQLFGTIGQDSIFYELKDDNNNLFHFQSKKYLGSVGQTISIKNCRVKAKKTFNDGKVAFVLASGTQEKYESFIKNKK